MLPSVQQGDAVDLSFAFANRFIVAFGLSLRHVGFVANLRHSPSGAPEEFVSRPTGSLWIANEDHRLQDASCRPETDRLQRR